MKCDIPKSMRYSKSISKREVRSNTDLPQETRKISNKLSLHLKELKREEDVKPKIIRRKKIIEWK